MSKRALEAIHASIETIDDLDDIEEAIQSLEKKRRLAKMKKFDDTKKRFIDTRGYFVSLAKDPMLDNDPTFVRVTIPIMVHLSSWDENLEADVDELTSKDKLFALLKIDCAELEKQFDIDTLDWSEVNLDRDDYRDPYRAKVDSAIYVYVKRQPTPSDIQGRVTVYYNRDIIECSIENNALVNGTNNTIVALADWATTTIFDVGKLVVTHPYALVDK